MKPMKPVWYYIIAAAVFAAAMEILAAIIFYA